MNREKRTASLAVLSTLILVFSVVIAGTSGFAVAQEDEAFFEVEITDYDEEVLQGEEVTVEYRVTNTGEVEDTQDIVFYVLNVQDRELGITLGAGEEFEGEFTWTANLSPADYNLQVMSADDSDSVTVSILPEPAHFQVEITDYDDEVEEGETVKVEFNVENTGEVEETQDIIFTVDGTEEDSVEVALGEGEEDTGIFRWEAEEEGEYELGVASEDTSDSVTVTVTVEEDEEEPEIPGFTTVLLMISVIIAVAVYYKKEQ